MSIPSSLTPLFSTGAGGAAGYQVSRSLRFNSADSAYLSRTPGTASNRKTWTWAGWVKRSALTSSTYSLFAVYADGSNRGYISYQGSTDKILLFSRVSGSDIYEYSTNAVFRDASAWYHVVVAFDTTQATASNRLKIYVNGVEQAITASTTVSQNTDTYYNTTQPHYIGYQGGGDAYYSGYLAECFLIDGQQLTPSSFTEVSATTGQLIPLAYTGTYGLVSVAAATGALPIFNTTDTYGAVKGTGTRTDTNSASIVLALPMDGTNGGTSFGDQSAVIKGSGSAKTITVNGNTNTSTTQSKFYGSSGYFDGSGDYLTVNYDSDLDFTGQFTFEGWVYPNVSTGDHSVFGNYAANATGNWGLAFDYSTYGIFTVFYYQGNTSIGNTGYVPTAGKWNHYAVTRDAGNVIRVFLNGQLLPTTATYSGTLGVSSQNTIIGFRGGLSSLNGSIQDVRFYKGVAKYTSNFSPVVSSNNSFQLKFADNSSNTAATLGKDTSGNGNNWTPNNLSVTAGAGNDSLVDTPTSISATDTGVGGEIRGNYCTLNPLNFGTNASPTDMTSANGNLDWSYDRTTSGGTWITGTIAIPSSGKWYFEGSTTSASPNFYSGFGIGSITQNRSNSTIQNARWYNGNNGNKIASDSSGSLTTNTGYGAAMTTNDVVGVAVNMDAGTLVFYKNGVSQGTAFSDLISSGISWTPFVDGGGSDTVSGSVNFGQRAFAYTAPSGFKALCDTNLPAPLVAKPNTVMDVVTRAGGGTTQTFATLRPGLVWEKRRDSSSNHYLFDVNRGNDNYLSSNLTSAEAASAGAFTFNTNSYTVSSGFDWPGGATVVDWVWDAGGTTDPSNQAGSITSQVRANATAGFSVVTYTGTGANATVGHGLGVEPHLIITKNRTNGSYGWYTYAKAIGNTNYLILEGTAAASTFNLWQNTTPTSSVFYLSSNAAVMNTGNNYVAYCFAPVVGYSSFGSYVGNGSTDGPFVYTGFRPRWLLVKSVNYADTWVLIDAARETYNVMNTQLRPNSSNAESVAVNDAFDFLSNGFKIRGGGAVINTSSAPFVYAAFAENPFQYSRAR